MLSMVAAFSVACEQDEDDKISQAQECLDRTVVPADAANCSFLIDGIYNPKANRIRCALAILGDGETTQGEILSAFQAMETGVQSPLLELSTVLGIGDVDGSTVVNAADQAIAESIKATCDQADSIGLRTIAELMLFGTRAQVIAASFGDDPENPTHISNNLTSMSDADAGEFGNSVFQLYCVPSYSNEDICGSLETAGAGTNDDATVGAALIACLTANNCN